MLACLPFIQSIPVNIPGMPVDVELTRFVDTVLL